MAWGNNVGFLFSDNWHSVHLGRIQDDHNLIGIQSTKVNGIGKSNF